MCFYYSPGDAGRFEFFGKHFSTTRIALDSLDIRELHLEK